MKLIIDIYYAGQVVDAHLVDVKRSKNGPSNVKIDSTAVINHLLNQAFLHHNAPIPPKKELDNRERKP